MKTTRLAAIIAIAAAFTSAGCFAGAYKLATANDSGVSEVLVREIPWEGAQSLTLGVEADLRYVQAEGPAKLVARGPHRSVSTLVTSDGYVNDRLLHTGARLELTLYAPAVSEFHLNGKSRLTIEGYSQPSLTIHAQGRTSIEVSGRAEAVVLDLQGHAKANLARLESGVVEGHVAGFATVVAAPRTSSQLQVRSSASVVLVTRPAELANRLEDAGAVIDASR